MTFSQPRYLDVLGVFTTLKFHDLMSIASKSFILIMKSTAAEVSEFNMNLCNSTNLTTILAKHLVVLQLF